MKLYSMVFIITLLMICCFNLSAEATPEPEQKVVHATRANGPVRIDAVLDETAWQTPPCSGFTQSDPMDGEPATQKTEVWVAYDDQNLYVAARMHEADVSKILSQLGRRDSFTDSAWFILSLDPYFDKRSGFQFAVNPAGSICDWTIFNDTFVDSSWDGIWESRARINSRDWIVEIRIPFNQLRFKKKQDGKYTWGVNFKRYIRHKNEVTIFSWQPKTVSGMVSHFARLEGIQDIQIPRYIEVMPYTVGKAAFSPEEAGNPYATGEEYSADFGLDMKIGLQSNLTLDLTVNPDFGQVEVDPALINLSAAESYYSEKRPFFIEGASIFNFGIGGATINIGANWGSPRFFYSRRIGRPPQTAVDSDGFVQYPQWTTILGAAKLTGKIGNGWNLGILHAVTQREYAEIDLEGDRSRQVIEPFSNYSVIRAQREFNDGRQGLGWITTSTLRDLESSGLSNLLNQNAFSLALDGWSFLNQRKSWVVTGWLGGTTVTGTAERISALQQSYPHYYQRPDADHVELDPDATSLSGWSGRFTLSKEKGNFLVNVAVGMISPGFDVRDMGFQWSGDVINGHIMLGYRVEKPGKLLRRWNVLLFTQRNYDFGGTKIGEQRVIMIAQTTLLNYWRAYLQISHNPEFWDNRLTRGGPLTLSKPFTWYDWWVSSDRRKALILGFGGYHRTSTAGHRTNQAAIEMEWKPSSNFDLLISTSYRDGYSPAQWITNIEDEFQSATYETRYVFGEIDQQTLACTIRFNWIFSPRLSLQGYLQPFIAVGDYSGFKELAAPRTYDFNTYGEGASTIDFEDGTYSVDPDGAGPATPFDFSNPDFNYKSLRGTVVLRWEFRPGSTLYAVWTQNRADFAHPGEFRFGRDFSDLVSARGDNIFMIKFTYRFQL